MGNRGRALAEKPEVHSEVDNNEECRHHWAIEGARGPISVGICKRCGKEQEFQNSWYDSAYMGKDARVFKLPNLLEEEPEGEVEEEEVEEE